MDFHGIEIISREYYHARMWSCGEFQMTFAKIAATSRHAHVVRWGVHVIRRKNVHVKGENHWKCKSNIQKNEFCYFRKNIKIELSDKIFKKSGLWGHKKTAQNLQWSQKSILWRMIFMKKVIFRRGFCLSNTSTLIWSDGALHGSLQKITSFFFF